MALDPSIILQGQGVNALGILDASNQMAAQQKDALHTQGYRNMLATSGAGIMAGDQNALNALAGYDPAAALVIQGQRQDMDYRSQQMAALSAQEKRQAEEYARGLSAEQRAAEAAQIEEAVKMGMLIPDAATWDQQMATMAPELVGQFDNRQALAGKYMSMADVLKQAFPEAVDPSKGAPAGTYWNDPGNPAAGVTPIPGIMDKPQAPYTPEGKLKADLDAGRISQAEYESGLARLAPKGTSLTVDPATGAVTFTQGAAAGNGDPTVGEVYNPGEADAAIDLIDQIVKDPALPRVTGYLEGGGGNDVDAFSVARRAYYGDAGLGVITKINQLQSRAWMAARAMLKGGGPITDYESRKAEAAVARLSRAQGDAEFVAALKDLRDAITEGKAKLEAAKGGSAVPSAPSGIDADLWGEMTPEERALFQ